MAASVVIRAATPDDAEVLARLRYEFRITLDPSVEDQEHFVARCTAWIREHLRAGGNWCCWIAEDSHVAIGTVWLSFLEKIPNPVGEAEHYGYVTNVYVKPEYRGAGIGSQLVAAAVGECDRRGVRSTVLWPTQRSRALYSRHGFAPPREIMERDAGGGSHHRA